MVPQRFRCRTRSIQQTPVTRRRTTYQNSSTTFVRTKRFRIPERHSSPPMDDRRRRTKPGIIRRRIHIRIQRRRIRTDAPTSNLIRYPNYPVRRSRSQRVLRFSHPQNPNHKCSNSQRRMAKHGRLGRTRPRSNSRSHQRYLQQP